MEKFKLYGSSIKGYEVTKETDLTVWFKDIQWTMSGNKDVVKQERKTSDYHSWHDSFIEAKIFLMATISKKIEAHREIIRDLEDDFSKAESMVENQKQENNFKTT